MLIDSNLIIYAAQPANAPLRAFIAANNPAVSAISYVEVLGFHRLTLEDQRVFQRFFASAQIFHVTAPILDRAIALRQQRRMSLGDSLIAATALIHNRTLLTRNVDDFRWISGIRLLDPLASPTP
jgi:predicted nucleic acid-binding protein